MGVGAIRMNSDVITWPKQDGRQVIHKVSAINGRYTGLVLLFSTNTDEQLAIFPDGYVQSSRVGATSALGAKYLAPEKASKLGVLGAGQLACDHLVAHHEIQDLESVRVYSPTTKSRQEYADEIGEDEPVGEAAVAPTKRRGPLANDRLFEEASTHFM